MLKTTSKDVQVHVDPYSFLAEIEVLSGSPVQNYNKDSDEYEPDRSVIPCVLMPYVMVSDPDGAMQGKQAITSVEWYEGAPASDGSKNNKIASGTDYVISDSGKPAYSLTVKKNVDYNSPLEIHCIFTFTDTRKGSVETIERSIVLRTSLFDSTNYSLKVDSPKGVTINPLAVTADDSGRWPHVLSAQLYSGKDAVPDENAAYWWQILDSGVWRDLTDDEIGLYVVSGYADGVWSKEIEIDARFFENLLMRVRAAYYTGPRPTAPASDELQGHVTMKVEMPHTLRAETRQKGGIRLSASMDATVMMECVMWYNKQLVPDGKQDLFQIDWYAKSSQSGSTPVFVGRGKDLSFVPSAYNFTSKYQLSVYAEVSLYSVHSILTDDSGNALTDESGNVLVAKSYK